MRSSGEAVVEFENVTISYSRGYPVLSDVSLKIFEGERVFVLGPNGGGKTTMLRTVMGLLKPDKGVVRLFGKEVSRFRDWWRIGYVPQNVVSIFEKIPASVQELLSSGSVRGRCMKPVEALNLVGVEEPEKILRKRISDLSGGNLQKVMLALALINNPELLLLDEPTVYVDQQGLNAFYQVLNKLYREWELTMVIATHDIAAVSTLASRVVCINKSALYDGNISDLLASEQLCNVYGFHVYSLRHGHRWGEK
ncbi:MAG: metal ABC transporter ATP-binding protein [Candidatus Caldarchaeum sp.]